MTVLKHTLVDFTDPCTLTVRLKTPSLHAVRAAAVLAGMPVDDVYVEVTAYRYWLWLRVAVAVWGRTVDVYAHIDTCGWRAALDEALWHKYRLPRVYAMLEFVCTSIEALHHELLDDMFRAAELMYADARRLTIRDRLVVRLRWAAANPDIPDETRAAAASLADLTAGHASPQTLRDAAEALGHRGLLATVSQVVTLSRGSLDRR